MTQADAPLAAALEQYNQQTKAVLPSLAITAVQAPARGGQTIKPAEPFSLM